MDKIVYEFQKNKAECVRALLSDFQGKTYASLRVYYLDIEDGEYKPTRKGITLNLELLPEAVSAVEKLKTEIDAMKPAVQ